MKQAREADEEIAAGAYRGPLHGIPWGQRLHSNDRGGGRVRRADPERKRSRDEGTPTSLRFTGQLFGEAEILLLAHAFQGKTDHHLKHPSL